MANIGTRNGIAYNGLDLSGGTAIPHKTIVIEIGNWNMDSTLTVNIAHNLSTTEYKTIISTNIIIRNDTNTVLLPIASLSNFVAGSVAGGITSINATNVQIQRQQAGTFDGASYSGTSISRGTIALQYQPDF